MTEEMVNIWGRTGINHTRGKYTLSRLSTKKSRCLVRDFVNFLVTMLKRGAFLECRTRTHEQILRIFTISFSHFSRITMFLSRIYPSRLLAFVLVALASLVTLTAQDGSWTFGNRLIVQGGISTPVANFGALPATLQDLIPADGKTPQGAAVMGFTLGLNDVFRFTPNLALSVSLDANYNAFNNDEAARQLRNSVLGTSLNGISLGAFSSLLGITSSYNAQAYINGTLTGGIRYDLPVLTGLVNVYGNAQAGLFYGIAPQSEAKLGLNVLGVKADATISRPQASATAFAYKIGAGVLLFDRLNVGVNYVAAVPQYIANTTVNTVVTGLQGNTTIPGLGTVNTQTIVNAVAGAVPAAASRYDFPTNVLQVTVGWAF